MPQSAEQHVSGFRRSLHAAAGIDSGGSTRRRLTQRCCAAAAPGSAGSEASRLRCAGLLPHPTCTCSTSTAWEAPAVERWPATSLDVRPGLQCWASYYTHGHAHLNARLNIRSDVSEDVPSGPDVVHSITAAQHRAQAGEHRQEAVPAGSHPQMCVRCSLTLPADMFAISAERRSDRSSLCT